MKVMRLRKGADLNGFVYIKGVLNISEIGLTVADAINDREKLITVGIKELFFPRLLIS